MLYQRHQSFDMNFSVSLLFKAYIIVKAVSASLKRSGPLSLNGCCLYTDPNSAIQASYFSRSAAETDLEIFLSVRVKSSIVTGICSSSLDRARISSGLRPWIRRRIAIMDASLMYRQVQRWTGERKLVTYSIQTYFTWYFYHFELRIQGFSTVKKDGVLVVIIKLQRTELLQATVCVWVLLTHIQG